MTRSPRLIRSIPFTLSMMLMMVLGIHGVMQGDSTPAESEGVYDLSEEWVGDTIYPTWLGRDLPALLGPLQTVSGENATVYDQGLILWVLIRDRECTVCLHELPLIASICDSLSSALLSVQAVAIGDRHEARRTLWGIETEMPVFVSGSSDTVEDLGVSETPVRILTWYGKIVGISEKPVNTVIGYRTLSRITGQWASQSRR